MTIKLGTIAHLDTTATAVQFKNAATGQYVVLKPDPRGGGYLEAGDQPEPTPWYFYQAAGAEPNNVEIKRKPVDGFNWSNYDKPSDAGSGIAWNHAKRIPSATAPTPPHDWYVEPAERGLFRIRWRGNGEYLELMPDLRLDWLHSTAPKIITRALVTANRHQQWELWADKVEGRVIDISSAQYGLPGYMLDARAAIQAIADRGDASFEVLNQVMGGDPRYGLKKVLHVDYAVNGELRHQDVPEYARFTF